VPVFRCTKRPIGNNQSPKILIQIDVEFVLDCHSWVNVTAPQIQRHPVRMFTRSYVNVLSPWSL